jgi:hypothetical protein
MVRMHTGNFDQDVPEASNARARAAVVGPHGPAPESPPQPQPLPPSPPVSIEQLLATHNEFMQVLTEILVHRGGS